MSKLKNQTKTLIIAIASIIILIILLSMAINLISKSNNQQTSISDNLVTRIIDGDTFQIASGETIRLICIDTPEARSKGADDASNFLFSLIYNREVRLESDKDDKDAYGRLLRYAYVGYDGEEIFVNKEIVSQGYGTLFPYGNNTEKCDEIGS